jgi:RNA polymerase sigma factor (sigma-70 family)
MTVFRDDPELLAAFRRGEQLDVVYRRYMRSLRAFFRVLARRAGTPELGQESVLDDLLQEAFLRAFSARARAAYDGVRDFEPYLKAIARNCFADFVRKRRSEPHHSVEEWLAATEVSGVEQHEDGRWVAVLETYLAELSPALKRVYEERFVFGLSQEVASQVLGLSRRSFRTLEDHLRRGVRKALLRDRLIATVERASSSKRNRPRVATRSSPPFESPRSVR